MKKTAAIAFFIGSLVMIYVMGKTGEGLNKQQGTPHGILNLELAYNQTKTAEVINAWAISASQHTDYISVAKTNTYWDFLFILAYAPFLYFTCKILSSGYKGIINKAGNKLAAGALVAGLLDCGENIGMLQTLCGSQSSFVPLFTTACSVVKWLLVIAAVLYILLAGAGFIYKKFTGNT
jgi:hypothetical protein